MAVVSNSLAFRSLQQSNVAWKLLHAQNAPYIMAILDEHLGHQITRRPVEEMNALVENDLEILRERVFEGNLSRSGKAYLEDWRNEGYLIRKPSEYTRQETYELSEGALRAIGFAKGLTEHHRTATKSRLSIIFDQLSRLSTNVSEDEDRLRSMLLAEREAIDKRLEALDRGEYEPIETAEALEQTREIISLAREIPRDFASVSAEFDQISKRLHEQLLAFDDEYTNLMEDVFAGVDHISQSSAGQSFQGFFDLLRDYDQTERIHDDIDIVLNAEFASQLTRAERTFLRHLMRLLLEQAGEVNATRIGLSRGLRRYVQSQGFQEDRMLKRILDKLSADAMTLSDRYSPTHPLETTLELTSTQIAPISRMCLKDPSESTVPEDANVQVKQSASVVSLADLRAQVREEEIDYGELTGNVNAALRAATKRNEDHISIGDVLEQFPATQGVASVLGLMMLGIGQGKVEDEDERVTWELSDGTRRSSCIRRIIFTEEVV